MASIDLTMEQQCQLGEMVRGQSTEVRLQFRARIIRVLAIYEFSVREAAHSLSTTMKTVRKWRHRFLSSGVNGLYDRPRPGAPPTYSLTERCEVIAIACDNPAHYGYSEFPQWTLDLLTEAVQTEDDLRPMSRSSIFRALTQNHLKPQHIQMWLHSKDPNFKEKVNDIVSLYLNPPENTRILSIDEKTGVQALERKYGTRLPKPGAAGRMEYEYIRHGTQSFIASFDIGSGEVFAQCRSSRTANDLLAFMEDLHTHYQSDSNIVVIWDNLNIHHDGATQRWTRFNQKHHNKFSFHYTPIHASWMNQIEIFFSILQRRCLKHGNFPSLQDLTEKVMAFIRRWNRKDGHPFNWTFKGYPMQDPVKEAV